jgi:hypothetical protein
MHLPHKGGVRDHTPKGRGPTDTRRAAIATTEPQETDWSTLKACIRQ